MGIWGMAPRTPSSGSDDGARRPDRVLYHAGAAMGAGMPFVLGARQESRFGMVNAMSAAMVSPPSSR